MQFSRVVIADREVSVPVQPAKPSSSTGKSVRKTSFLFPVKFYIEDDARDAFGVKSPVPCDAF